MAARYVMATVICMTATSIPWVIGRHARALEHNCTDIRDNCRASDCGKTFTFDECRKTCKFCNEDCRDLSQNCGLFTDDICETEDSKYHCQRFCGLCFPRQCARTPHETSHFCQGVPLIEQAPSDECYDETENCNFRSCWDDTTKVECRRFCGQCRPYGCNEFLGFHAKVETSPLCYNQLN